MTRIIDFLASQDALESWSESVSHSALDMMDMMKMMKMVKMMVVGINPNGQNPK